MRFKRTTIAGAVFIAALAGGAWAQSVITQALTGNETVRFALPGSGTGGQTTVNALRNATALSTIGAATTVNASSVASTGILLVTGAVTTLNVTLPQTPFNGQQWGVNCPGGNITTLTISANQPSGVSIVGTNPTVCSSTLSSTGAFFTYVSSDNKWYRTE